MDNDLVSKIMEFKKSVTDIDGRISASRTRVSDIKDRLTELKGRGLSGQAAQSIENMISDINTRIDNTDKTYKNIKSMLPQAEMLIPRLKNSSGLGLNMAPIVGITAAAGTVIAAVYGFTKLLDPVERNINEQDRLLGEYTDGLISESEYNTRANELMIDLNNQNYDVQKATGVNFPVVVIGAALIYGGYKIFKKWGYI